MVSHLNHGSHIIYLSLQVYNATRFANVDINHSQRLLWLLSASLSLGVVNVLVTTPLWVVNTRLKLQGSKFRNADIRPTNYSGILGKWSFSDCAYFVIP